MFFEEEKELQIPAMWRKAQGLKPFFNLPFYPRAKDHPIHEDLWMGTPTARGFYHAAWRPLGVGPEFISFWRVAFCGRR